MPANNTKIHKIGALAYICGKRWTIRYLMGKLCEFLVLNIFLYSFIYAGFFSQNV